MSKVAIFRHGAFVRMADLSGMTVTYVTGYAAGFNDGSAECSAFLIPEDLQEAFETCGEAEVRRALVATFVDEDFTDEERDETVALVLANARARGWIK